MIYPNSVARSVRRALLLGLGACAISSPVVLAQDNASDEQLQEEERFERIQVTGSRLNRTDLEGATPVTVITRADIDATGFQSVSDVLRNNSFNVQGSIREDSGNTAQGQATMNLRGLGAGRTLILLNGRRMPGSPVMNGQTQNLNSIPFAAVERIEILSDGASAVYGSDAIGGVINIILRDNFEGIELSASQTFGDHKGGDEKAISIVGGSAGDRGQVTWVMEHDSKDIIFARDRHFFQSYDNNESGDGLPDYNRTYGYSVLSRNILRADTGQLESMVDGDCSVYGEEHSGIYADSFFPGDTLCVYDYTDVMAETASLDRYSMFIDGSYDITHDHQFYARGLASRTKSFGRYAPAAGGFRWTGPTLEEEMLADGQNMRELRTGDFVYYRFDITGPARDNEQTDNVLDLSFGFKGFINGPDIEYDVAYTRNIYEMHEWGTGYVNQQGLNAAAEKGWDPRDPDQSKYEHLVAAMRENSNRRASLVVDRYDFGLQGEGPGDLMYFVGGEIRSETYNDEVQSQAEAGLIIGTAGGSSGGSRDMKALFTEVSIPVTDTIDVDAAIRFDDYSDFGSAFSWKLASRWQPTRDFIFRVSAGTGFRAPSLSALFQQPSQGFFNARDISTCMGGTISEVEDNISFADDLAECLASPTRQHETMRGANPNLGAETSMQYFVGGVYDFTELLNTNLSLSVDYYYTQVDDTITAISTQDLMWLHFMETVDLYDGVEYNDPMGGEPHKALSTNFTSIDMSGLDVALNWSHEFGWGRLSAKGSLSYILENNKQFTPGSALQDYTKLDENKYRADLTLGYQNGDHSINWHTFFLPSRCHDVILDTSTLGDQTFLAQCSLDADGEKRMISSWHHSSVNYNYETSWDGKFTLGVSNVFDREPPLDHNNAFDKNFYPFVGRQYSVRYTQRF